MEKLVKDLERAVFSGGFTFFGAREVDGSEVTAAFADGYTAQGNFLVGADGIGSTTRRLLDATARPEYAGYVAWRGLEPESALPGEVLHPLQRPSGTPRRRVLPPGQRPEQRAADGESAEGSRRVNWVWYANVAEPDLPPLMTGRSGRRYAHFLPPGEVPTETADRVAAQADVSLPPQFAQLVRLSDLFMQPVYDLAPRRMVADHAALVGDAAGTVRPHTASGTSKAFGDAAGLAAALQGWTPDTELPARALEIWETQRLGRLVSLAESGLQLAARSTLGIPEGGQFLSVGGP
ncbi:FAD binding domain-containing protein [Streptomyces sp. NBC_01689]|uniref:FAD binding domain-containing protein n=2 Tax=unclassified Streptomyces TaxID=2593676 RepID=UPI002E357CF1|nr:hypothetical protein [Streptomyces sp. NBC_01689]